MLNSGLAALQISNRHTTKNTASERQIPAVSQEIEDSFFTGWAWSLMTSTDILAVLLLDNQGAVVDAYPKDLKRVKISLVDAFPQTAQNQIPPEKDKNTDDRVIDRMDDRMDDRSARYGMAEFADGRIETRYAARQGPDGQTIAIITGLDTTAPSIWSDVWIALLIAITTTGSAVAAAAIKVRRTMLDPVNALTDATRAGISRTLPASLLERNDQIGALASNVDRLLEELHSTRSRFGHLERTMDARVAARTRKVEIMLKQAEKNAWIDPLTRLGNRRLLEDRLESLVSEHRISGEPMTIVMFDVDNFKGLNDELGHAAGDELLVFIGQLLKGTLRASDLGLRLGGDEFAAILLGTSADEAMELADRVIKLFGQRARQLKVSRKVSMSAGVATTGQHWPENADELLQAADEALYTSKRGGKSMVSQHRHAFMTIR